MEQVNCYFENLARLSSAWQGLPDKPYETPDTTLRSLWFLAKGDHRSVERTIFAGLPILSAQEMDTLKDLVDQRLSGKPLAHLTQRQVFMGIEMLVGPAALIPRKETEILGAAALAKLKQVVQERGAATVIDLCTGCGNLALALAHHEPDCRVFGSDISAAAVDLARANARHLGLGERVEFRVGDLFSPFEGGDFGGKADLLICNPPYISASRVVEMPAEISGYEPVEAFDGGPFGVSILFSLLKEGPAFLKPGSWLGFEIGLGQGEAIIKRMKRMDVFGDIQEYSDADGNIRALFGFVPGHA